MTRPINGEYAAILRQRGTEPVTVSRIYPNALQIVRELTTVVQEVVFSGAQHLSQQELIDLVISSANKTSKPTEPR